MTFQFTHPGKGATSACGYLGWGCPVSIHAPWEGCDRELDSSGYDSIRFNSRTLGRVRPTLPAVSHRHKVFQFTHPGKGATVPHSHSCAFFVSFNSRTLGRVRQKTEVRNDTRRSVSIHAPWEGCDCQYFLGASPAFSFNSRTLGRVRQVAGACARLGV